MSLRASNYRRYAEFCLDMAEPASDQEKSRLHEMAEAWLALATGRLDEESRKGTNAPSSNMTQ